MPGAQPLIAMPATPSRPNSPNRPASRIARSVDFMRRGLWSRPSSDYVGHRRTAVALLQLLAIIWEGLIQNRLLNRAAALSYASLIGIGPLIAIVVFVSASFLKIDAESYIKNTLFFVAPTLTEYTEFEIAQSSSADQASAEAPIARTQIDELIHQIVSGAERIIEGIDTSGSRAFGAIGIATLIVIAIQLLTSIETTFNLIWGVRRGRGWGQRIVFYWTFITLGAVLGIGSAAFFSAATFGRILEWMPLSDHMEALFAMVSPYLSLLMITALLTFAYSFFPNTTVKFRAALIGSVIVALLLAANNYLSVLYVNRVLTLKNLYGSLGIVPVLLIGLYFFWVLILLGGQLTYAIQNLRLVAHQHAWSRLSRRSRESLALAALIEICRNFTACKPPLTASELAERVTTPSNLLNESLTVLIDIGWIRGFRDQAASGGEEMFFLPARPLDSISLSDFIRAMNDNGEHIRAEAAESIDPVVRHYWQTHDTALTDAFLQENLESLLKRIAP